MSDFGWGGGDIGHVPSSGSGSGSGSSSSYSPKKVDPKRQRRNDYVTLLVSSIIVAAVVGSAIWFT